jgi:hypothetical protein
MDLLIEKSAGNGFLFAARKIFRPFQPWAGDIPGSLIVPIPIAIAGLSNLAK